MRYGLVLLALYAFSAACAQQHPTISAHTLRIGVEAEPNSLNPLLSSLPEEVVIDNLIFDPLLAFDMQGNATPILASEVPSQRNGGISRDGLTITYRLRRDAHWHDGVPVTSRDVVFSYNAVMNPRNNVTLRDGYTEVKSVAAPTPYTVVFHLKRRYAPIFTTLFGQGPLGYVMPAHLLSKYTSLNEVDFNRHPIGDGAFRFVSWKRGDSIELAANQQYYRGRPRLQRIIVRFVPDDNTRVLQLRSHDIDVLFGASANVYPHLTALQKRGIQTIRLPTMGWNGLTLNVQHSPLDDVQVRRAIAMGIDKISLIHNVLHDAQPLADEDIPRFSWAYANGVEGYHYDPPTARRLLRSAGWGERRMRLVLAFDSGNAAARSAAVQIQSSLANIGIDVDLKGYPASVFFANGQKGTLEGGHFDLAYDQFINHSGEPDDSNWVMCSAIDPVGFNDARYCNPQLDSYEQVALTTYDRIQRRRAYARIERTLAKDVPYVFVSWQNVIVGADSRFHGLRLGNFELSIANAQQWSF